MITAVNADAEQTKRYDQFVLGQLIDRNPRRRGELLEIRITEDKTPFPAIAEYPIMPGIEDLMGVPPEKKKLLPKLPAWEGSKIINAQLYDTEGRGQQKVEAIMLHTAKMLASLCVSLGGQPYSFLPLDITLQFVVDDPAAIHKRNEKPLPPVQLDANGNLWREPKNKYCYRMGERSNRHRIVHYLHENDSYQNTSFITQSIGKKDNQYVRTEISKIRKNIKKFLGTDYADLIESKKDSGYRINPKYTIIPADG